MLFVSLKITLLSWRSGEEYIRNMDNQCCGDNVKSPKIDISLSQRRLGLILKQNIRHVKYE